MTKCSFEDAHLIPESDRAFEIPNASSENEYGIGQSNFWYIQKFEAARSFEKQLLAYIDDIQNKNKGLNTIAVMRIP